MADWEQQCPAKDVWDIPVAGSSPWVQEPGTSVGTLWDTSLGGTFWDFGQTLWDVSPIHWAYPGVNDIDTQRCPE